MFTPYGRLGNCFVISMRWTKLTDRFRFEFVSKTYSKVGVIALFLVIVVLTIQARIVNYSDELHS
jgi:hypothetical protein